MFKSIMLITVLLMVLVGCSSTSRTAKVISKEDYESNLNEKYPKAQEDQVLIKELRFLLKTLLSVCREMEITYMTFLLKSLFLNRNMLQGNLRQVLSVESWQIESRVRLFSM